LDTWRKVIVQKAPWHVESHRYPLLRHVPNRP
jgi:hypothetical protein